MNPGLARALVLSLVLLASGCSLAPTFHVGYRVDPMDGAMVTSRTVAVVPFVDERPKRERTSVGKLLLLYIPGVPCVTRSFRRVDEIAAKVSADGGHVVDMIGIGPARLPIKTKLERMPHGERVAFRNSFAAAIANDLSASKICPATFRLEPQDDADLVLSGTLLDSQYRVTASSWCLGLPGMFLWVLPFPVAKVTGTVTLELVLTDAASGAEVWRTRATGEETAYRSVYELSYMPYDKGLRGYGFSVLKGSNADHLNARSLFWWQFMALRRAMQRVKPELVRALRS